jgi:transposase
MVAEICASHATEWAAMRAVSELLGIGTTVRKWVRQAQIDDGMRPGTSTEEFAELKRFKREKRRTQAHQRNSEGCLGLVRG